MVNKDVDLNLFASILSLVLLGNNEVKSDNITRSNKEKSNIDIAILENCTIALDSTIIISYLGCTNIIFVVYKFGVYRRGNQVNSDVNFAYRRGNLAYRRGNQVNSEDLIRTVMYDIS